MNLRRLDLNLLVALDALLRTRHVTRAAQLVGIGQPGMSAALTRLRRMFGDDLLVKQGMEMVPTSRALELEPEVRRILHDVDCLITESPQFDPATSRRTFRLRLSDLLAFLLLPGTMRRLGAEAPGVTLEVAHFSPEATVEALERNEVELAASTKLKVPKSIESSLLFEDRVVCLHRRDHPKARRMRDIDVFLSLRQIRVSQSPLDDRFADRQLAQMGRRRAVALTLPHWLAVPEIVASSDLVAVMPMSIARRVARDRRVALASPPFENPAFAWALYWHRRHNSDHAHQWLRRLISDASADLKSGAAGVDLSRK